MAILDNYSRFSQGIRINAITGKRASVTSGQDSLYREGTGRRKKPSYDDQTSYTRKSQKWSSFQGWYEDRYRSTDSLYQRYEGFTGIAIPGSVASAGLRSPTQSFDSNIRDLANLKALKKFNQKDMDLGTAWKERGKTMNLVAGVAHTGVEALNAIRRRDGRGLLDVLGLDHHGARGRGVVDANLAYHYGMKPLLQDVAGAVQALTRLDPDQWAIWNRGSESSSGTIHVDHVSSTHPVTMTTEWQESCRVQITATPRPLSREDDLRWALGLDDPLSTGWEITPYSFVADWLIPVGDWLAALNSIKYYTGWTTISSQRLREEMKVTGGPRYNIDSTFYRTASGQAHGVMFHLKRTVLSGIPLAGLPIRNPVSYDHMAKALSLLASKTAYSGDLPPMIRY